ncbi:MAG: hypothetical protein A3B44_01390 [Candidatus Levybacteria bacterium RIFCSPLOWO2_01_FULL_38_21]|nr:MAG: hypothetical protein A3B44_01390 [Candidatus Levybacteria bacterium RIFCSPLOWO2_01_FULL_38_21]
MKINVKHVAKLANLPLSNEEEKKFEKQLNEVLSYVEKLNEKDVENIEETNQTTGLENVTREDINTICFAQDEALSNSKKNHNGMFKIPKIF